MEAKTFSKNSLHWRLASVYGPMNEYAATTDICSYGRAVMKGALVALLILVVGGGYATGMADFGAWLVAGLIHGFTDMNVAGGVVTIINAIAIIVVSLGVACTQIGEWRSNRRARIRALTSAEGYVEPEPSVYTQWYRSFKEKTCFRVSLK